MVLVMLLLIVMTEQDMKLRH